MIREIMDILDREQHQQLMQAFDNGLADYVEYETGLFIGVNINPALYPKLKILEERGKWCIGELVNESSEK